MRNLNIVDNLLSQYAPSPFPNISRCGSPCWEKVGHGGKTNVLVNRAAGACLEEASLQGRTRALVAEPIVVKVSQTQPFANRGFF